MSKHRSGGLNPDQLDAPAELAESTEQPPAADALTGSDAANVAPAEDAAEPASVNVAAESQRFVVTANRDFGCRKAGDYFGTVVLPPGITLAELTHALGFDFVTGVRE